MKEDTREELSASRVDIPILIQVLVQEFLWLSPRPRIGTTRLHFASI